MAEKLFISNHLALTEKFMLIADHKITPMFSLEYLPRFPNHNFVVVFLFLPPCGRKSPSPAKTLARKAKTRKPPARQR